MHRNMCIYTVVKSVGTIILHKLLLGKNIYLFYFNRTFRLWLNSDVEVVPECLNNQCVLPWPWGEQHLDRHVYIFWEGCDYYEGLWLDSTYRQLNHKWCSTCWARSFAVRGLNKHQKTFCSKKPQAMME